MSAKTVWECDGGCGKLAPGKTSHPLIGVPDGWIRLSVYGVVGPFDLKGLCSETCLATYYEREAERLRRTATRLA